MRLLNYTKFLYQGWVQSLAPHYSIVEGNREYSCISLSLNLIGYSTTQSLVEEGTPKIVGTQGEMNSLIGRLPKLNSPLKRFTTTFGLNYKNFTNCSKIKWSTNKMLSSLYKNGVASVGAWKMKNRSGWLVLATTSNITPVQFSLVLSLWTFFQMSIVGLQ